MHVEGSFGVKVPGMGCVSHVIERFEDSAFREEFGPTTSPEESFARNFKIWFNETENKSTKNVITFFTVIYMISFYDLHFRIH